MAGPKKRSQHWLLWWMVDQGELISEVARYRTANPLKTARGVGALCLLFSVAITLAFVLFHVTPVSAALDALVSLVLAAFIYFGHRWAMLAAMGWWTLEKVTGALGAFGPGAHGALVITQTVWWCIYMHAFWLAFRVEQARRKQAVAVSVFD